MFINNLFNSKHLQFTNPIIVKGTFFSILCLYQSLQRKVTSEFKSVKLNDAILVLILRQTYKYLKITS